MCKNKQELPTSDLSIATYTTVTAVTIGTSDQLTLAIKMTLMQPNQTTI